MCGGIDLKAAPSRIIPIFSRILRNTGCAETTARRRLPGGQIFCLTNVCSASQCEAGTITPDTSKPFCSPQSGARFREPLYSSTCTTYNTEAIKASDKDAAQSFTSLGLWKGGVGGWGGGGTGTGTGTASCSCSCSQVFPFFGNLQHR